jgi:hypothetical protein
VIEVDSVKEQRHGTSTVADLEDFSEAGRRARKLLAEHDRVIIVEAFAGAVETERTSRELSTETAISHVYLWCEPDTAVSRKSGQLPEAVVRDQSQRFSNATYTGRFSLDTTKRSMTDLTDEIAANLTG